MKVQRVQAFNLVVCLAHLIRGKKGGIVKTFMFVPILEES